MKYDVSVTGLGDMALAFLDPAMEMRFVILFNDDAPAELADNTGYRARILLP